MSGPLAGTRVLEFSHIAAGPYCGRVLSDLGADVIKVEPPEGDHYRSTGSVVPGTSKNFQSYGRGRRSIVLDLAQPRAREVVHRLAPSIDVVLTNLRVGIPERLEIDYETLRALRPDLVYLHISGFGQEGPLIREAASDIIGQAYSGVMGAAGKLDGEGAPLTVRSIPMGDLSSALAGAMAVCAALFHRSQTGEGQFLDVSILRSAMSLIGDEVMREPRSDAVYRDRRMERVAAVRARGGSYAELMEARQDREREAELAAARLYDAGFLASDGPLVISAQDARQRAAAARILGVEDVDFDHRDAAASGRLAAARERIAERVRQRPLAEWLAELRAAGVPAAPVQIPEEVADAEQIEGYTVTLDHPLTGPQRQIGPLFEMSRTPPAVQGPAPALGEHSDEILAEAGYTPGEIRALREEGAVS